MAGMAQGFSDAVGVCTKRKENVKEQLFSNYVMKVSHRKKIGEEGPSF